MNKKQQQAFNKLHAEIAARPANENVKISTEILDRLRLIKSQTGVPIKVFIEKAIEAKLQEPPACRASKVAKVYLVKKPRK